MCEVLPHMIQVAMAGKAVTKVVHRCYSAKEDRNLDLSECQLMSFPEAVYHLMRNTVVLTCDLSSNVFRKIPAQLPIKFVNITELNLSHNRLSTLPEELKDLKELKKLDVSHNDFLILPKVAFKIPHLLYLNLKKNYIADIDISKIKASASLKELNMEENPLTRTAYFQLKSLPSNKMLVHVTEPQPEDDDDDDFDASPPNSSL
ncbi:leucine-rich repeat-containing protein 20-like [Parasteatoda tepidariorum]|uniref:leucine-rich repeat-containing protein 20-like n=1 Tax=Parasteatoda tepidariorum TaxID=114398 RepID=UPI00077F9970|nr:leucine-rich repeat-containing protein 20-like [Parasteatoda tepidariorum]